MILVGMIVALIVIVGHGALVVYDDAGGGVGGGVDFVVLRVV